MEYIFVTIQAKETGTMDMKVPGFVTVNELLTMLSESLKLSFSPDAQIQAEPLGRILEKNATLENEGITNGSLLTIL